MRYIGERKDPNIHAKLRHIGMMVLWIVPRIRLLEVRQSSCELSDMKQINSCEPVGHRKQYGIRTLFGE